MTKFIVELDEVELAVIMAESACGVTRREGISFGQAWDAISKEPYSDTFLAQARAAIIFFGENVHNLKPVN